MARIITPLDNIINIVNDLIKNSHANRRGSSLDSAFDRIISNVNDAKNCIIEHFIDKTPSSNITKEREKTYVDVVQSTTKLKNNLIIPMDDKKPDKETITQFEADVYNIIKEQNIPSTILKTSATDNGNLVVNFQKNDDIVEIKDKLTAKYGKIIKMVKPFQPKIKIVSVPSQFELKEPKEIIETLVASNDVLKEEYNNNKECIQFLFQYKVGNRKTLVLKCSPKLRQLLKSTGDCLKVYFKLCKVYDRHHVFQCSKCCQFGHSRKNCKSEITACTFCGDAHDYQSCPIKNEKNRHKCYNCFKSDNSENANSHGAFDANCPIKNALLVKMISRTDNGFDEHT